MKDLNPAKVRCAGIGRLAFNALDVEPLIGGHLKAHLAENFEPNWFLQDMSSKLGELDLVTVGDIAGSMDDPSCLTPERSGRS